MILFLSISAQGQVLGDLNCDGVVNQSDCGPFILAMTNPTQYAMQYPNCNIMNADMNSDGFILCDDWNLFQQALGLPLPPCANIPCPLGTTATVTVPTVSEWSQIILMVILGMVSVYYLKRLRRRRAA